MPSLPKSGPTTDRRLTKPIHSGEVLVMLRHPLLVLLLLQRRGVVDVARHSAAAMLPP